MDRLTSLNVFGRVVDCGGFSAAARRLNMSVTMVSSHVQALEERLGARLLNRTTRHEDFEAFNTSLDDDYGDIQIAGSVFLPSKILHSATLFGLALLELEPLIETLGRGSTGQTELSRDAVGELKVVVAARPVRRALDGIVVPIRDRVDQALAEAQTLGELRDTLLPKLISGELRIAEAENRIAAT